MSHIRQIVTIGADPAHVLERWSSLDGIRAWWTTDASGGAEPGEEISLGFGPDERQGLRVIARDKSRVEWAPTAGNAGEWEGTRIVCTVEPHEAAFPWQSTGTLLRLEHLDWADFKDYSARCNTTWARLLLGFKRMCEHGGASLARLEPKR